MARSEAMKMEIRAADRNQRQCNVNKLMTPEMRRQIRQLKQQLDEYVELDSEHYELMVTISLGLDTARDTARCLMARDPFDAWARLVKAKEEEFDADFGISEAEEPERSSEDATAKVTNLITMEMRQQQIREAKEKLEDYASFLGQFFRELNQLDSFKTALKLADALRRNEPLETREVAETEPRSSERNF
jgi:hypothetical protein